MSSSVLTPARPTRPVLAVAGLALCSTAFFGCASPDPDTRPAAAPSTTAARTEVEGTRLGLTYDGGVLIVDRSSLAVVADLPLPGFLRLNPAGDDRHLLVSTEDGFHLLDTGVEVVAHGDHAHYYGSAPALTATTVSAPKPGHVVRHAGRVALFSDGAGTARVTDPATLADPADDTTYTAASPHHGIAVPLADGQLLVSVGTEERRTGAQVVDADGQEVARTDQCPGIHGEATARDGAVVVGCTDGVVVYRDGRFTKVASPDAYGRIGNQSGSERSPIVLGDYKTDPDAELERPERVSLIDTRTGKLRLVDLGTSYSFRSLARGPKGEAIVLGTDGALHVIDPSTGRRTRTVPVVPAWTEPTVWQRPRPTVHVDGILAYVTEPETSTLHVVDLDTGTVIDSTRLPHQPNEIVGVG